MTRFLTALSTVLLLGFGTPALADDCRITDHGAIAGDETLDTAAIQSAIDVSLHVLAHDTDRTPEDYGSAFTLLAEAGAVRQDLAARLRLAAGLRNLLVHAYLDVDPRRLWEHLEHLEDLEEFAQEISEYLDDA